MSSSASSPSGGAVPQPSADNVPTIPEFTGYRQTLYEQAWENYRNEDASYRALVTQYAIFAATLAGVATQAKGATTVIGALGIVLSLITIFHVGRLSVYSLRWLKTKAGAIGESADSFERSFFTAARASAVGKVIGWLPGSVTAAAVPAVGLVFFLYLCLCGQAVWN